MTSAAFQVPWQGVVLLIGVFACGPGGLRGAEADWREEGGYRWAPMAVESGKDSGFRLRQAKELGIQFENRLSESSAARNRTLNNGSGVALGDLDGDGRVDLFFAAIEGKNRLYRNLGGWRFEDVTARWGLPDQAGSSRGAVMADVNGDGRLDLLVAEMSQGVRYYQNTGEMRLVDRTREAGLEGPGAAMTLALSDVDGDGDLDLYVARNRTQDIRDEGSVQVQQVNGQLVIPQMMKERLIVLEGQVREFGEVDDFFLNQGKGIFQRVSWTDGFFRDSSGQPLSEAPRDWGLSVAFRDFTGDGLPDLYVCNDFWTPDRIWVGRGAKGFEAMGIEAVRVTSGSSMGVDFADYNRDGGCDFFVVDMLSRDPKSRLRQLAAQSMAPSMQSMKGERPQVLRNTLFQSQPGGFWVEQAWWAGVAASEWSWSPQFVDIDLDGYEDLMISSGHFKDVQDADAEEAIRKQPRTAPKGNSVNARKEAFQKDMLNNNRLYPDLKLPMITFRNQRDGTFEDKTLEWGTEALGVHHGWALGDLDGDGDLDAVVNNLNEPAGIYQNISQGARLLVRLLGKEPNTQGIGATVILRDSAGKVQEREVMSGGKYLSGNDPSVMFGGLDREAAAGSIQVKWRNGQSTKIEGVRANRIYEIRELSAQDDFPELKPEPALAIFRGIKENETWPKASEISFDDRIFQPLMPYSWSQKGPSVVWRDFDRDGDMDLIVGGGRGGNVFVGFGNGMGDFDFTPLNRTGALGADTGPLLAWRMGQGLPNLWVPFLGYELEKPSQVVGFAWSNPVEKLFVPLPQAFPGGGPMAMGDLDGDGTLELLIAAGMSAKQFPRTASSGLYRWRRDLLRWEVDTENSQVIAGAERINGALWSDLTGDGYPELVLSCEWDSMRVYENGAGRLKERTREWGFDKWKGMWQGLQAGDFDGDGRMDLVCGNWGWNHPYRADSEHPYRLYYGDLMGQGRLDLVEAVWEPATGQYHPTHRFYELAASLPFLYERVTSHRRYGELSVEALLGDRLAQMGVLEVNTFSSMALFNRGQGLFEAIELPLEAQMAPVVGMAVGDWNLDGRVDLALGQNLAHFQRELGDFGEGRGGVLMGTEGGEWEWLGVEKSGIRWEGFQRGVATSDFDGDGRADLAVGLSGGRVEILKNQVKERGIRVKVAGPDGNPDGVGAKIGWKSGREGEGETVWELRTGSGYWSGDGEGWILAAPFRTVEWEIEWVGGRKGKLVVRPDASEVLMKWK